MTAIPDSVISQLDDFLSLPKQIWLLGAGISKEAGVPLMSTLTDRVEERLDGATSDDFAAIRQRLRDDANIEHILSRIGNLIGLAEHSQDRTAPFGDESRRIDRLHRLHAAIQDELRKVVQWGYIENGEDGEAVVGTEDEPVIKVDDHYRFVQSLFDNRRAGLEQRPPVAVFTTNYDTLLEDAFALNEVKAVDGFSGGTMAFWNPTSQEYGFLQPFRKVSNIDAKLYKLHGSIDWRYSQESTVIRRRPGAAYPDSQEDRLLVYPQATKYRTTQQEPFSHLFRAFRRALNDSGKGVMCVCGYGFGDRHINSEIHSSLSRPSNSLTLIACAKESESGEDGEYSLPNTLRNWLTSDESWTDRLIVVSDRGFYHKSLENQLGTDASWDLWNFQGLTDFLSMGPEVVEDV